MSDRRTLAPFGRRPTTVTANREIGAYRLIACRDATGPVPRPGQFYMLTGETWGGGEGERPFLPRAFSFLLAAAGELSFLLEDVGPGTHRLAELEPGEQLWLTGPLGAGFVAPRENRRPVLVGGGIGIVPLAAWQEELSVAGDALALLGFRGAAHAAAAELLGEPEVAPEHGSLGHRGLVTELLARELDRDPWSEVYACGPPAMLEAVRAMCAAAGVPAQIALESPMACGFGACYGCAVPTRRGLIRLCVEGPVLDAAELDTANGAGAGH
jgi:NAD(P)H-flavin reductase